MMHSNTSHKRRIAIAAAVLGIMAGGSAVAAAPGALAAPPPIPTPVTGNMEVLGSFSLSLDKTSFTVSGAIPGATGSTGAMPGTPALTATVVDNSDAAGYDLSLYPLDVTNGNTEDGSGWWYTSAGVPGGTGGGVNGPNFFTQYNNTSVWFYPSGLAAGGQYEPFTSNDGVIIHTSGVSAPLGDAVAQGFKVTPPSGTTAGAYSAGFQYLLSGN
jgi:hypothetical protein